MSLLTKEQLLAKRERKYREVDIPELGGHVRIRSLKSKEITTWQTSMMDKHGNPDVKRIKESRERLVMLSVVDDSGNLVFGRDDLESLNNLENSIIDRIAVAAHDLNGIDETDYEAALGNSSGTQEDTQALG